MTDYSVSLTPGLTKGGQSVKVSIGTDNKHNIAATLGPRPRTPGGQSSRRSKSVLISTIDRYGLVPDPINHPLFHRDSKTAKEMVAAGLKMQRISARDGTADEYAFRPASSSRPASIASEASTSEYKPPSILRRTSNTSSLGDHHSASSAAGTAPPSPVSRRGSRIRFAETPSSSASGSRHTAFATVTETATETGQSKVKRTRSRPSSTYVVRPPSPSDFEPRPLPTLRYVDGRAETEVHVPRRKTSTTSTSSSGSSKRRSLASGSGSRRASARFSILSDQDLDMLEQMGGIPNLDDFLPSPTATSAPPRAALPTLELDADLTVLETPVAAPAPAGRGRALSPITGEDEATPVPRPFPTFDEATPHAHTGHTRGQASIVSLTPLLGFPIPPARNLSLESVQSLLVDEIGAREPRSTSVTPSLPSEGTLQPAPSLGAAEVSPESPRTEHQAEVNDQVDEVIAFYGSDTGRDERVPEATDVRQEGGGSESLLIADAPEPDVEALCMARWPGSPSISDMLFDGRRSVAVLDPQDEDDEFAFDYHTPLHEAAVRSGIISSRSKLIWTDKPKRRSFMHRRLSTQSVKARERDRTGWSGSESEEEEFHAVLADIAHRRRLAIADKPQVRRSSSSYVTPSPRRSSYRMSTLSTTSSSGASASSVELLTPDPHRPTSFSFDTLSPLAGKSATSKWATARAPPGSALGISVPAPNFASRRSLPKPTRKVRGWGKPETLLEHDEPPAILSSSDEDDDEDEDEKATTATETETEGEIERPGTPPPAGIAITITVESPFGPSQTGADTDEGLLMDETEPLFDDEAFSRKLAVPSPSRYLGIPF